MKRTLLISLLCILALTCIFSSCGEAAEPTDHGGEHIHAYGEWITIKRVSCTDVGINERYCTCGEKQTQTIEAIGHTEVVEPAVAATCTTDGKTEGKRCSVCSTVLVAQESVAKLGHTEVVEPAVAATCTTDGKTEGKHCSVCSTVLVAQESVAALGHKYNDGVITKSASCLGAGSKLYTCTNPSCQHTYTEEYSLTKYSATELYNQSVRYVGEIVTYDKSGKEYAMGTGFVISADGRILTNYHVLEKAYSAKITINGVTYDIASVLAYDADIDLAVIKINATNLTSANVCKSTVQAGETVYAIGSSRGMTNTYSQGIITYAGRVVDGVTYVQHDASITHGNSGGPLINVYGEVIGINTWGISDSQNLNFAVFAAEIDKLTYGTPMTMEQFYSATSDPYETLVNWVLANYNYSGKSWVEYQYQKSGERFAIYSLTYFKNSGTLAVVYYYVFNNGDARYVTIELTPDSTKAHFLGIYTDGDNSYMENTMEGYIYLATFTRNTSISYTSSDGNYWGMSSLLETYQEGLVFALDWFRAFLSSYGFGYTLSDFGFTSFS